MPQLSVSIKTAAVDGNGGVGGRLDGVMCVSGLLRIALTEAAVCEDGLIFYQRAAAGGGTAAGEGGGVGDGGGAAASGGLGGPNDPDGPNNDWLAVETFGEQGEDTATRTHTTDARAGSLTVVDLALDTTASVVVRSRALHPSTRLGLSRPYSPSPPPSLTPSPSLSSSCALVQVARMLSATDSRGWEILEPVLHVCGRHGAAAATAPVASSLMAVDLGRFRILERIIAMVH